MKVIDAENFHFNVDEVIFQLGGSLYVFMFDHYALLCTISICYVHLLGRSHTGAGQSNDRNHSEPLVGRTSSIHAAVSSKFPSSERKLRQGYGRFY